MLSRVLKEAVLSKELDIERLEADLASSLRIQDVMRNEIQRVQDKLSCVTHKAKQLELQVTSHTYPPINQQLNIFSDQCRISRVISCSSCIIVKLSSVSHSCNIQVSVYFKKLISRWVLLLNDLVT